MAPIRDRRAKLADQSALNGIDFVEIVNAAQTHLRVHFLNPQPDASTLADAVKRAAITGGDTVPVVEVPPLTRDNWEMRSGRPALNLFVAAPGDFSTYVLTLESDSAAAPAIDRFFNRVRFSFKATCPSTLDCKQPTDECPPTADAAPPIDYLAKDFESFRRALSDFSALRYPSWQERSEADFGVMFMEALASLADDLSYQQDRIAAEAWLETATERRSLVRLGRLVDYEPRAAVVARVMLQFEMAVAKDSSIPAGLAVSALAPDGGYVEFETGTSLADTSASVVDAAWNRMQPHWWDDDQRCLQRGTTEMWIERPSRQLAPGQRLLIDTTVVPPADPPVREIVELVSAEDADVDLLYGTPLTRITWRAEDALRFEHDLTMTRVCGNLVPATQGRRHVDSFFVSRAWPPAPRSPRAIVRTGANGTPQFLHTLRHAPLAWLAQDDPAEGPRPEVRVLETTSGEPSAWHWHRSLLGAGEHEQAVTIDPVAYRTVDAAAGVSDYDGSDGATLRFGDGVFGAIPGDDTTFEVTYRSGGGARGNVAAGTITRLDAAPAAAINIISVTNPLAASGGRDEEPNDQVREMAPQRFRAIQYRAVRAEDYSRAAMTLPWVQRAGTQFRYTGSWLSVFAAVDPVGSETLPAERQANLSELLDRYRLAGYEAFGLAPRYASLDLDITVCARPDAFRGQVKRDVLEALGAAAHLDGTRGFFYPDRFTFGLPLERSAMEAAIQDVPGVAGVVELRYRRRGQTPGYIEMPDSIDVAADEIVRVDNDPSRPERGSLRVNVRGGK